MPKELNNEKKQPMKAKELQDLIDFIAKSGLNKVNIETDMQGKYIEKFMQEALDGPLQELRNEIAALRQQMQK